MTLTNSQNFLQNYRALFSVVRDSPLQINALCFRLSSEVAFVAYFPDSIADERPALN